MNQEVIEPKILHKNAKNIYGDRKIVSNGVGYYLKILRYFDILNKNKSTYSWEKRQIIVPDHILKEMLILYSHIHDRYEIDVLRIQDDVAFSLFDLSNLENVLMEYNGKEWAYQKELIQKVIITNKYKELKRVIKWIVKGFKEWNAVVEALGQGKQSILMRTYSTTNKEFLLYPTFSYANKDDYLDMFKTNDQKFVEEHALPLKKDGQVEIKYFARN